ncbi:hypothetical protein BDQ12DRAFT_726607 [Crucibulum laeve]|uniref:BTB domain-containing protein n=1 Tax=Crucibulum laeve TaxID=68775 RepID=A0A5C3LNW1_9AGAR|nr:hypothetical protein BDQ12DRAFT_726607 [Crucibulum laeve]
MSAPKVAAVHSNPPAQSQDSSVSRKRQRVDEPEEAANSDDQDPDNTIVEEPVRDPEFYREDGDCVILVENTLFRIHRYLLARDNSAFVNMFNLPNTGTCSQTKSDGDPLVLHDSTQEFRAFCWALYALPSEVHDLSYPSVTVMPKLIRVAVIANKYHFITLEKWSMGRIEKHFAKARVTSAQSYFTICPIKELSTVLCLTIMCNSASLRKSIQDAWLKRIKSDNSSLSQALELGCTFGLREFQGFLYYQEVMRMNDTALLPANFDRVVKTAGCLTIEQERCLYRGYWTLSQYQNTILQASTIPILNRGAECGAQMHNQVCERLWIRVWGRLITLSQSPKPGVLNVMQILEGMLIRLEHHGRHIPDFERISPSCRVIAHNVVSALEVRLKAHLPDYFLGELDGDE